jgi:hypothetical protein
MSSANTYRMTIWSGVWYHKPGQSAKSVESNFKAALRGDMHANREELRELGIRVFRDKVRKLYGRRLSPEEINIRFEREEPTSTSSPELEVQSREYSYRGKQMYARQLPTQVLRLNGEEDSDEESEEDEEDEEWENGDDEGENEDAEEEE